MSKWDTIASALLCLVIFVPLAFALFGRAPKTPKTRVRRWVDATPEEALDALSSRHNRDVGYRVRLYDRNGRIATSTNSEFAAKDAYNTLRAWDSPRVRLKGK